MTKPSSGSAALAPVRRWVLYSPWRLAGLVCALLTLLVVVSQITRPALPTITAGNQARAASATSTEIRTLQAGQEVTANDAGSVSDINQARKSPQIVAMKFAMGYIDISSTTGQWITTLTPLAAPGAVSGDLVAQRPVYPVSITGSTSTAEGGHLVIVPTSVGDLSVRLDVDNSGWLVNTPLPHLENAAVDPSTSTADSTDSPEATDEETPTTTPSTTPPQTAPPTPTRDAPRPTQRPKPGPIPIPNLEGPLPA